MKATCLALAVLLLASCGGEQSAATKSESAPAPAAGQPRTPPPPDATRAAEIVANSAEFGDYQFTRAGWSLPVSVAMMNDTAHVTARQLEKAGWISLKGDTVVLSEKATNDKRFLVRPNGFIDIVPLARKEFLGVTALNRKEDGTVAATFSWQWVPNDIAQAISEGELKQRFEGERQATATLMWDGSAWTVLRIAES